MYLFFSDLHLGRTDHDAERAIEQSFVQCLKSHQNEVTGLYLLGDIFDQYIEYRHMIPKGWVRLMGLLASWSDTGIPITYLLGNHDPWHQSYFKRELGLRIVADVVVDQLSGHEVYLSHGDQHDPTSSIYQWLRPILRHPVPVFLYRYLLPGDSGYSLARWANRTLHANELDAARINGLREHARHILCTKKVAQGNQLDMVVFAHSHHHELTRWEEGIYMNPGAWRHTFTYGVLDECGPRILQWNGSTAHSIEPTE